VTAFGLLFTPTFYVVCRALGDRIAKMRGNRKAHDEGGHAPELAPAE